MNMKTIYQIAILLLLPLTITGQDELSFKFSGFADTYHALRSQSPYDFMSSRSRLRTEMGVTKGKSHLFASLNSVYNSILNEQTGIELREAFFQYTSDKWDFKAGRQIVIWGVADGLRITDIVSPMDYTEFLAQDFDDIRIPVNAFKLKYYNSKLSAEAVFIPVSSFFIIPTSPENAWSVIPYSENTDYRVDLQQYPEKTLKNCEFGGRLSFFLSGIDFSVSALHTWNKLPVLRYLGNQSGDTINIAGQYNRMDMLGIDLSFPLGQFVFRGEIAEYFGELQETISSEEIERNTTNFLIGIDWYPGSEWTISGQYSQKFIPEHMEIMTANENTAFSTLSISKSILHSTLKLSTFGYYDLSNSGFFNRTSADYSLTDQIHLLAGYDWFHGDEGMFSLYKDNSEIWVKAKFNF
jgi:hypothetical protein